MKKTLDVQRVKEFVLAKGERVGLVICGVLGIGLLVLSVSTGMADSARKWWEEFIAGKKKIENQIAQAPPNETKPLHIPEHQWRGGEMPIPLASGMQWIAAEDKTAVPRRMPRVLAVGPGSDPKKARAYFGAYGDSVVSAPGDVQLDFILAGIQAYDVDFSAKKIATVLAAKKQHGEAAETLKPRRLVVVSMVYDMKPQYEEFAQALGFAGAEHFAKTADESMKPRVVGLDIVRLELPPGGGRNDVKTTKLYEFREDLFDPDKENKQNKQIYRVAPESLDQLFRTAIFDKADPYGAADSIVSGLATPLPQLVTGKYPKLRLAAIKSKDDDKKDKDKKGKDKLKDKGKNPFKPKDGFKLPGGEKKGMPGGEPPEIRDISWDELDNADLKARLTEGYFPFDPDSGAAGGKGGKTPPPKDPKRFPKVPPKGDPKAVDAASSDVRLIRFIDVDVEPGYQYAYSVQVYLANPYFNRKDAEAKAWADEKLLKPLPDSITYTPIIAIPGDYYYFATDQTALGPLVSKLPASHDKTKMDPDHAAVQIHQWIATAPNLRNERNEKEDHLIGDWVIAERLLVRRGGVIGRRLEHAHLPNWLVDKNKLQDVIKIEMPEWDRNFRTFRLALEAQDKKSKKTPAVKGIDMILLPARPPVVVDFEGGKRAGVVLEEGQRPLEGEETAYEMLILDPSGELVVRHSAEDSVLSERVNRHKNWEKRLEKLRPAKEKDKK